jgi:hypothetical protein
MAMTYGLTHGLMRVQMTLRAANRLIDQGLAAGTPNPSLPGVLPEEFFIRKEVILEEIFLASVTRLYLVIHGFRRL